MLPQDLHHDLKQRLLTCFSSIIDSERTYWLKLLDALCEHNSKIVGFYQSQLNTSYGVLHRRTYQISPTTRTSSSGFPVTPECAEELTELMAARAEIERKERVVMNLITKVLARAETIQDLRDSFIDQFFDSDPMFAAIQRTRPTGWWYQPNTLDAKIDSKAQLEIRTILALRLLR